MSSSQGGQITVPVAFSKAAVSHDGRRVGFDAASFDQLSDGLGPSGVYMKDLVTGWNAWVSTSTSFGFPSGSSTLGDMSGRRSRIAFASRADDLTYEPDTNRSSDVFVWSADHTWTRWASRGRHGSSANGSSVDPTLSGDGRYVAFASDASNLVAADTNGHSDVFLHDMRTGATRLVSLGVAGRQGNGPSRSPVVSKDGRLVSFASEASNLVPGDTNACSDVFVRDLRAGTTVRVSMNLNGRQARFATGAPFMSADGHVVGFVREETSRAAHLRIGYVRDLTRGRTERVGIDSGGHARGSWEPGQFALSGNGRFVLFSSFAPLTVDDTDPPTTDTGFDEVPDADLDVFVRDRLSGTVMLVSVMPHSSEPVEATSMDLSVNGRWALIRSAAPLTSDDTNELDELWVRDLAQITR